MRLALSLRELDLLGTFVLVFALAAYALATSGRASGLPGHTSLPIAANSKLILVDAEKEQRGRLSGLVGLSRNLGLMTGAPAMPTVFVTFLGTVDVSVATTDDIAHAYSMTFVIAAGLTIGAISLAIYSGAGCPQEADTDAK